MEEETKGKAWPLADAVLTDQVQKQLATFRGTLNRLPDPGSRATSFKLQAAQEGC